MNNGDDLNGQIAALLRDLAAVQPSERSGWGYKRAANSVLELERPIETLLQLDGTLEKIPNVGPKSETVILEFLEHGRSETVEAAVAKGGKTSDITRRRGLRSNFLSRAQVLDALNNESLIGPSLSDYRGDLQMHSTWSDGGQSLDDIAKAALERSYEFCALTDHSYGLPIANGLSMVTLAKQHRAIDLLNRKHRGQFRLIKGIEANIRKDGSVDMTAEEREQLEFILAAPHSSLRLEVDQTSRMIEAVRTPGLHVLGHPRGRMYGSRAGVQANWDEVFSAAADAGVAVEIDGDPSRQDLDHTLARRALSAGCLFALDSDAHSAEELEAAETAIAHARLAGIPAERIINCWPLARLLDWLRVKH
ncbi:MAG: polX 1 [Gemmatimonadetes bacterium]|nr:polX 1 [Gemmatimonadota bacterium]